jgi:hypothetical protein
MILAASIPSLQGGDTFAVIVANESGPKLLGERLRIGGRAGWQDIEPYLQDPLEGGPTDTIRAVDAALQHSPKTIVLLIREKDIENPAALAARVKAAGARLVIVMLGYKFYQKGNLDAVKDDATVRLYDIETELTGFYEKMTTPP